MQLRAIAVLAAVLLPASFARAVPFDSFVSIDTEEDLYDLQLTDEIDEDALQALIELYQRGVDLNRANREELYSLPNLTYAEVDAILAYRELVGWINQPVDLVANGVLSQEKLEAIAAFLLVSDPTRSAFSTDGWLRAQTRWSIEDGGAPPMALQARVSTLQDFSAGFAAAMTRTRLTDVVYDPSRGALSAKEEGTGFHLPKAYVEYEGETFTAIAGTYRIGFGQSLTFDNTSATTPNGFYSDDEIFRDSELTRECKESAGELSESPCAGEAGDIYVSPDYRWRESLLGVALGLRKLPMAGGEVQTYGWMSYNPRSIYQYELYSPETCDDPTDDDNPACGAPDVFRTQDNLLEPTSRFSFRTLPNMYSELIGGGNVSFSKGRRAHVGVTGYGSSINWLVQDFELDFQEWSRTPYGGPFGAVGVNGAYGFGRYDLFAEVTRAFDSMPDSEPDTDSPLRPWGSVLRFVTTFEKYNELETSVRYYGQDFANPYARPISAADEFDGSRARNEVGGRMRYTARLKKRLNVRGNLDLWGEPSGGPVDTFLYARADVDVTDQYRWGLWLQHQNKDLGDNGRGNCFEVSVEFDESGEPIPCAGEKYQAIARLRYAPTKRYTVTGQYQHELVGDARYDNKMRQDSSATVIGTANPHPELRLRGRLRYLFEDITDNSYLEQSVWAYADASYRLRARDRLRLRYDVYVYLDDRASSQDRIPSPEHWLWLEYESRF